MATQYIRSSKVEIGTTGSDVDLTSIIFVAVRLIGSGPRGEHVEFIYVRYDAIPIGEIHHPKYWEIVIAFDENVYTALFNTDVEEGAGTGKAIDEDDDNTAIGLFKISIVDNAGTTVTWSWATSTTFIVSYFPQITTYENWQPCEVKFISRGVRTVA